MWGARMDEQLPPFPEPAHQSAHMRSLPNNAQKQLVTFSSVKAFEKALPPVRSLPFALLSQPASLCRAGNNWSDDIL